MHKPSENKISESWGGGNYLERWEHPDCRWYKMEKDGRRGSEHPVGVTSELVNSNSCTFRQPSFGVNAGVIIHSAKFPEFWFRKKI